MSHKVYPPNGYLSMWIASQFPPKYKGYCIDIGASDGISVNTTWYLEKEFGWTVVSVEPNPQFHDRLKAERAMVELCAVSDSPSKSATFFVNEDNPEAYSSLKPSKAPEGHPKPGKWHNVEVPVRTLEQILTKWDFPRLDALCVDTEGTELEVLKGLDMAKWRPKVVVCESWEEDGRALSYLECLGYKRTAKSADNYLFVLGDQ